ncbi:hypothetical protein Tco_0981592 [Tanacetum coccineum]
MCHRGTSSLTKNVWGPPRRWGLSLGIIAGERIPCETSPVKIPQLHFAGECFPQRQVAGESGKSSLGKILIVDPELTQARARGWYLARGCTVYVCNSRDMFVDYEPVTSHEYLISVVKLTDIGFSVSFGGDQCAINKGRNVIGKGYKEDGLYWLSVLEENSGAKVVHNETISLMVCNESPELTKTRARGWVLSITCTVHVCNSRDMFLDYHPLNGHEANVVFGGHVKLLG